MDQNVRLRLTVKSAKELSKRDLFQYPSPFCRITIDGSGTAFKSFQELTGPGGWIPAPPEFIT